MKKGRRRKEKTFHLHSFAFMFRLNAWVLMFSVVKSRSIYSLYWIPFSEQFYSLKRIEDTIRSSWALGARFVTWRPPKRGDTTGQSPATLAEHSLGEPRSVSWEREIFVMCTFPTYQYVDLSRFFQGKARLIKSPPLLCLSIPHKS